MQRASAGVGRKETNLGGRIRRGGVDKSMARLDEVNQRLLDEVAKRVSATFQIS